MTKINKADPYGLTGLPAGAFHFALTANRNGSFRNGVSPLPAILVLLSLIGYGVFLEQSGADEWTKSFSVLSGGAVLLVLYQLNRRKREVQASTCALTVHKNKITLSEADDLPVVLMLKQVSVEWMAWSPDGQSPLPAVCITGPEGRSFSIGLTTDDHTVEVFENPIPCTDFLLASGPAWVELQKALTTG